MRVNELMIYKNIEEGEVLQDMAFLMENYDSDFYNQEDLKGLLFDTANQILELAVSHGFEGNLWHTYLTFLLANHENAYSTSCEIVGEIQGLSMRRLFMISGSSRNCLTMTSGKWKSGWERSASPCCPATRGRRDMVKFTTRGSGTGSVSWRSILQRRRQRKPSRLP